jgi:hypothetical protein
MGNCRTLSNISVQPLMKQPISNECWWFSPYIIFSIFFHGKYMRHVSGLLMKHFHMTVLQNSRVLKVKGILLWAHLFLHTAHHVAAVLPEAAALVSLLPSLSPSLYLPTHNTMIRHFTAHQHTPCDINNRFKFLKQSFHSHDITIYPWLKTPSRNTRQIFVIQELKIVTFLLWR